MNATTAQRAAQSPSSADGYVYAEYFSVFGYLPPERQEMLAEEVRKNRITKTAWRDALEDWRLCGYSPRNLSGLIEYACKRPAGRKGPVVSVHPQEQPEPEIQTVTVRLPDRVFQWDVSI